MDAPLAAPAAKLVLSTRLDPTSAAERGTLMTGQPRVSISTAHGYAPERSRRLCFSVDITTKARSYEL